MLELELALSAVRLMIAEAWSEIFEVAHSDEAESEMETIRNLWQEAKDVEALLDLAQARLDNSSKL